MFRRLQNTRRFGIELLEQREMLSNSAAVFRPTAGASATTTDDYGNTFALASQLSLSAAGAGSQSGKIETSGDVDVFKFIAPVSGKITIQELAASGSRLDSYLYVYNSKQQLVALNDDYGRSLNSQVVVSVTAGETYYIKAAAFGWSTGAYSLQLSTKATTTTTDDFGNTIAAASTVTLSSSGSGSQSGKIETSGDVDVFKVVATTTGTLTVQQTQASGSTLTASLAVYDANGNLVQEVNTNGSATSNQIQVSVVAGTTYYVKVAGYQTSTGGYSLKLSTAATTTTTPTESGFQITTVVTGMTAAEQAVIEQAVERWESIIVGDLSDVTYQGRVIDDIEIAISGITIDGSGNVLGQSTATAYRRDSDLPYLGYIELDTADVASMLSDGSLLGVIEHEIAHVLGFGVIWSDLGLLTGTRTNNPGFTGANAVAEYNTIFGTNVSAVPVEADGGSGTRLSHWDETVFGNELMTGWYNSGVTNPLSRITVASMADLGYQVNMAAADTYTPSTSALAAASSVSSARSAMTVPGFGGSSVHYVTSADAAASPVADAASTTTESDAETASVDQRQAVAAAFSEYGSLHRNNSSEQSLLHDEDFSTNAGQRSVAAKRLAATVSSNVNDRVSALDSWFAALEVSGSRVVNRM